MAINYGNTIMEGGIEPSVQIQSPVQDDSEAVRASISGTIADAVAPALNFAGQVAGSIFQQNQQNASTKILTSYESDLLDLADAVDQGSLSTNAAMVRARNIRRQYLGNSPDLQADFDKIWTNFATSNGLGHVVVEGTIADQAEQAINLEAQKLGYTRQEYDVVRARSRELTAITDQYSMIQSSNGIVSESMKAKGLQAVIGVADAAFPAAKSQIDTAMQAMTNDPAQRGAIAQQTITSIRSQVAAIEGNGMGAETSFITKPINDLLATFEQFANNSVESAVIESQLKYTQLQYDAMFTKDPVLGPFIAQSNLLKSVGLENSQLAQQLLNDEVIKALRDATDPDRSLNILNDSAGTNKVVQSITDTVGTNLTPEAITEMQDFLGGVVDGAYVNERAAKDGALGYKGTIEILGSPAVTEFVRKNGSLPAEYSNEFVQVIKENYESGLLPVIQSYWSSVPIQNPTAGEAVGMSNTPMSQLLDVVWNGNAVEFVPKAEWADNPRIVALANDVNTGDDSIGVPLNNLINAHANVTGTNAKTVWEQQFANQLFNLDAQEAATNTNAVLDATATPEVVASPVATLDQGMTSPEQMNVNANDLTLEDFNPDPAVAFEQITRVVENTSASNPSAVVNATSPVAFAQAYLGLSENNHQDEQVLSSFIRSAAGISINPAKTAWCAAFVDAVLHASGVGQGTGKLNARSYLDWGKPVSQPQEGDVVVLWRDSPDSWKGHVGFYAGMTPEGKIKILGGNQGDSVSLEEYDAGTVLGYRRAA